jgi:hypothetical protein
MISAMRRLLGCGVRAAPIRPACAPAVPTGLASVGRMILHYSYARSRANAPTDLASVERMILHD